MKMSFGVIGIPSLAKKFISLSTSVIDCIYMLFAIARLTKNLDVINRICAIPSQRNNVVSSDINVVQLASTSRASLS
jgi:hypothetical protein